VSEQPLVVSGVCVANSKNETERGYVPLDFGCFRSLRCKLQTPKMKPKGLISPLIVPISSGSSYVQYVKILLKIKERLDVEN